MYGYSDDNVSQSGTGLVFGLNAGTARLVKFEWINDAGKDGAEAEALDIQFLLEGADRTVNYRLFPITKAFLKTGGETNDPKAPEFQAAVKDFNSCVTHILHCFLPKESIQAAFSQPISNFKEFCKVAMSLLPKDYEKIPLDLFAQWQWQIKGEQKKTYLELPRKMSYGRWVCAAVPPVGSWHEVIMKDPSPATPVALKYVDDEGTQHPFVRNGWFMLSNFAKQQSDSESISEGPAIPSVDADAGETGTKW